MGPQPHPFAVKMLESHGDRERVRELGKAIAQLVEREPRENILPAFAAVFGSIMADLPFDSEEQYRVMTDYISLSLAAITKLSRPQAGSPRLYR